MIEKFSAVPNKEKERVKYTEVPFNKENLGNIYKIVPVKDTNKVEFMWILDN